MSPKMSISEALKIIRWVKKSNSLVLLVEGFGSVVADTVIKELKASRIMD